MSRNRNVIVACLDFTVPVARSRVDFQRQRMLLEFGKGFVQQDELAVAPFVKEPPEHQLSHSAETVGRDACRVRALVDANLLAQAARTTAK